MSVCMHMRVPVCVCIYTLHVLEATCKTIIPVQCTVHDWLALLHSCHIIYLCMILEKAVK